MGGEVVPPESGATRCIRGPLKGWECGLIIRDFTGCSFGEIHFHLGIPSAMAPVEAGCCVDPGPLISGVSVKANI